jgi:hypothetical protein
MEPYLTQCVCVYWLHVAYFTGSVRRQPWVRAQTGRQRVTEVKSAAVTHRSVSLKLGLH